FSDKLKKALRDLYSDLRIPVQQSIDEDACPDANFEDMFVELRLDEFNATIGPEIPDYRDVDYLQKRMQSSKPIQLAQLFDKIHDKDVPRTVLILGRPGVGKTTVIKKMARLWAKGQLWKGTVEYLFVITLRHCQQDRKLTLADLLLDGLELTDSERTAAMKLLRKQRSKLVIIADERDANKDVELNTMLSSITANVMLPGAKIVIMSRPRPNLPRCNRKTELYGFTHESIQKYIHQFSREDSDLEDFISDYLQNNVNIASMCYLPVHCNFVCVCLHD
ncbi:MAG: NACHT domain-containing protein, partial [Chromatiales bacterium]